MITDSLAKKLSVLDGVLDKIGVSPPAGSDLDRRIHCVRQLIDRVKAASTEDKAIAILDQVGFKDIYDCLLVLDRLAGSAEILLTTGKKKQKDYLKKVLSGELAQGSDRNEAKDFLYELWLGSRCTTAGFDVEFEEPDLVLSGRVLSRRIGVACKYIASPAKIHDNITKGYAQIQKADLTGFVAVGAEQLVLSETGLMKSRFVDFGQGEKDPAEVLQRVVDEIVVKLHSERKQRYPSEVSIDGLVVSCSLSGLNTRLRTFATYNTFAVQTSHTNPIRADIIAVATALDRTLSSSSGVADTD